MSTRTIRILTLNAHQGFTSHKRPDVLLRMRDALRAADADMVFLQEIGLADGATVPTHQYEILAEGVWPQHAYGRNAVSTSGHHGNALLSKYPITDWSNVDASVTGAEPRGLLHCQLAVPCLSQPLQAVCLHFGLIEPHRQRQLDGLLALIATLPADAPLVVAGDFNDWRSLGHRRLQRHGALQEVHAGAAGRPARTFPARLPLLRLDRIYVRHLQHRPLPLPRRCWSTLSDHVPIGAEVWESDDQRYSR